MPEPLFSPDEMTGIVNKVAPEASPANPPVVKQEPAPKVKPAPKVESVIKIEPVIEPVEKPIEVNPLDIIPKDVLPEKKKPDQKSEERLDAEAIKVEDYPQTHRANVANLRKQMLNDQRRLKALEAKGIKFEEANGEITVVGGTATNQAEFEKLQQRVTEQEAVLERTNLIESKGFKEKYVKPLLQQKKLVYDLATGLLPEKFKTEEDRNGFLSIIDQLSGVTMPERVSYLKKYFPESVGSFIPLFQKIDELNQTGSAALENWKTAKEELGAEQKVYLSEQTREAKTIMMKAGLEDVSKRGYWMFKKTSGIDEHAKKWNAQVDTLTQQTAAIFDSDDPKLQTEAIVRGVAAEYLLGLTTSMQTRIEELQEQLSQYEVADPSIRGIRKSPSGVPVIPGSMTAAAASKQIFAKV